MKNLQEYINELQQGDTDMKPPRIMAPQNSSKEALWNSSNDRWSRNAKHPMNVNEIIELAEEDINEESSTWAVGDTAIYNDQTVEITIPNGPDGTIGIMFEGELKMVTADTLTEGVMGGMTALSPINRMMQLAGISNPTIIGEEQLEEADATNMFNQLFRANLSGEFKNNPPAARLATVGQIMVGLGSMVNELKTKDKIAPDLATKLDTAVGLGAFLMQHAQGMLKA